MNVVQWVQRLCNATTTVNANANQDSQEPSVMNVCLNLKGTSVTNVLTLSMDTQLVKFVNVMSKDLKAKLAIHKANALVMTR